MGCGWLVTYLLACLYLLSLSLVCLIIRFWFLCFVLLGLCAILLLWLGSFVFLFDLLLGWVALVRLTFVWMCGFNFVCVGRSCAEFAFLHLLFIVGVLLYVCLFNLTHIAFLIHCLFVLAMLIVMLLGCFVFVCFAGFACFLRVVLLCLGLGFVLILDGLCWLIGVVYFYLILAGVAFSFICWWTSLSWVGRFACWLLVCLGFCCVDLRGLLFTDCLWFVCIDLMYWFIYLV